MLSAGEFEDTYSRMLLLVHLPALIMAFFSDLVIVHNIIVLIAH